MGFGLEGEHHSLSVGRERHEAVLIVLGIVIAILFLALEMLREDQLSAAVSGGQRVQMAVVGDKTYARLREDTKQRLEMTARMDHARAEENQAARIQPVMDDKERGRAVEKNTQLVHNFLSVWMRLQEEAQAISLKGIAQK